MIPSKHKKGLINSRLEASLDVLDEIGLFAHEQIGTHFADVQVAFLGDLFHKRGLVPMDVLTTTLAKYREIGPRIGLAGNHDFADREGTTHSLQLLDSIDQVVRLHDMQLRGNSVIELGGIDYHEERDNLLQALADKHQRREDVNSRILFLHAGVQGATVGSDYVMMGKNDLQPIDYEYLIDPYFDLTFLGHYHQHQKVFPYGWYVGATHQHNWGDANTKRGFLHVTFDPENPRGTVEVKHIETTSAPRFHVLEDGDDMSVVRPGDFVRILTCARTKHQLDKLRKQFPEDALVDVFPLEEETKTEAKLNLLDDFSPSNMITRWAEAHGATEDLTTLGQELYGEASE